MQRKGGRCFPWTSGRRPFFPPSPMLPATRCGKGGFPYSQPNQLRAHTELQRGGNLRRQRQVPSGWSLLRGRVA